MVRSAAPWNRSHPSSRAGRPGPGRVVVNPGAAGERLLRPLSDGNRLRRGDVLRIETGGGVIALHAARGVVGLAPFGGVHDLVGDLGHPAAPKNWGPKDWGVRKPS